jgi:SAM-dependent methyltransferase
VCDATARRRALACRDHLVTGETFGIDACDGCGLRITTPQPDPQAIWRYYESDAYLPTTRAAAGTLATVYRAVRRVTVRLRLGWLGRERGRLLDVGCGTGEFLAHARTIGWDVLGVEPSPRAAAQAEALGVTVRRTDDLATVDDGPFDAITMWHVLEHLHDPGAALDAARRLLAPGGRLLVGVPNHDSLDAGAYGDAWYAWDVPRHLWHFTPATLRRLLARHGLAVDTVHAPPFDPFYIALLSERRARRGWNLARVATVATRSFVTARRDPARGSAIAVVASASA